MNHQLPTTPQTRKILEFLQELCGAELVRPFGQATLFFEKHRFEKPSDERQRLLLDRLSTALGWIRSEKGPLYQCVRWFEILELVKAMDLALARREIKKVGKLATILNELVTQNPPEHSVYLQRLVRLATVLARNSAAGWRRLLFPGQTLAALESELLLLLGQDKAAVAAADLAAQSARNAGRILYRRIELAVWVLIMAVYRQGMEELYKLADMIRDALAEATASAGR